MAQVQVNLEGTRGAARIFESSSPAFWVLPSAFLSASAAAAAVGFINCTASIGGLFGPKMVGDISQRSGSFNGGFAVMIACFVIASVLVLICPRERV